MAKISASMKAAREEELITFVRERGSATYSQIAKALNLNYYTVRNYVGRMFEDGRIVVSRQDGQTIYFAVSGSQRVPAMINRSGDQIPMASVLRKMLEGDALDFNFYDAFGQVLALIYAQPLLGEVSNGEATAHKLDRDQALVHIAKTADFFSKVANDLIARIDSNSAEYFQAWYHDPNYDAELAITMLSKFIKNGTQPYIEAYRKLREDAPVGTVSENDEE